MHGIFFDLKRAWHGSLRITRRAFDAFGLTAARFDLLYAAARPLDPRSPITQSQLRRALGVNRTTVSRMLTSLEALGLVRRAPAFGDQRTRAVRLTADGKARLELATEHLMRSGAAQLAVDSAIGGDKWHDEAAC